MADVICRVNPPGHPPAPFIYLFMKSCLVLTFDSHARLMKLIGELTLMHGVVLDSPTYHAHHLTLSFKGALPEGYVAGNKYKFTVSEYGISDEAIAFFVDGPVPGCESGNPHVTLATSKFSKPVDSLSISEFFQMMPIELEGVFRYGESCFSLPLEK